MALARLGQEDKRALEDRDEMHAIRMIAPDVGRHLVHRFRMSSEEMSTCHILKRVSVACWGVERESNIAFRPMKRFQMITEP